MGMGVFLQAAKSSQRRAENKAIDSAILTEKIEISLN